VFANPLSCSLILQVFLSSLCEHVLQSWWKQPLNNQAGMVAQPCEPCNGILEYTTQCMASSELVRNARQHCHQLQTFENIFKAIQTTVKGDKSLNIFSKPCKPFSKPLQRFANSYKSFVLPDLVGKISFSCSCTNWPRRATIKMSCALWL